MTATAARTWRPTKRRWAAATADQIADETASDQGCENFLYWYRVMATRRNIVISLLRVTGWANIAAGLRHHARHPDHALKLVITS
jgi:hypothetical protein